MKIPKCKITEKICNFALSPIPEIIKVNILDFYFRR